MTLTLSVTGNAGGNRLRGDWGDDSLYGGDGNDILDFAAGDRIDLSAIDTSPAMGDRGFSPVGDGG